MFRNTQDLIYEVLPEFIIGIGSEITSGFRVCKFLQILLLIKIAKFFDRFIFLHSNKTG